MQHQKKHLPTPALVQTMITQFQNRLDVSDALIHSLMIHLKAKDAVLKSQTKKIAELTDPITDKVHYPYLFDLIQTFLSQVFIPDFLDTISEDSPMGKALIEAAAIKNRDGYIGVLSFIRVFEALTEHAPKGLRLVTKDQLAHGTSIRTSPKLIELPPESGSTAIDREIVLRNEIEELRDEITYLKSTHARTTSLVTKTAKLTLFKKIADQLNDALRQYVKHHLNDALMTLRPGESTPVTKGLTLLEAHELTKKDLASAYGSTLSEDHRQAIALHMKLLHRLDPMLEALDAKELNTANLAHLCTAHLSHIRELHDAIQTLRRDVQLSRSIVTSPAVSTPRSTKSSSSSLPPTPSAPSTAPPKRQFETPVRFIATPSAPRSAPPATVGAAAPATIRSEKPLFPGLPDLKEILSLRLTDIHSIITTSRGVETKTPSALSKPDSTLEGSLWLISQNKPLPKTPTETAYHKHNPTRFLQDIIHDICFVREHLLEQYMTKSEPPHWERTRKRHSNILRTVDTHKTKILGELLSTSHTEAKPIVTALVNQYINWLSLVSKSWATQRTFPANLSKTDKAHRRTFYALAKQCNTPRPNKFIHQFRHIISAHPKYTPHITPILPSEAT